MIARYNHNVKARGFIQYPVELAKRIVQVGYEEESHWGKPKAWDIKVFESTKESKYPLMALSGHLCGAELDLRKGGRATPSQQRLPAFIA